MISSCARANHISLKSGFQGINKYLVNFLEPAPDKLTARPSTCQGYVLLTTKHFVTDFLRLAENGVGGGATGEGDLQAGVDGV